MNDKNKLGDFLRKKRLEKNWAVYKLHRHCGISTTYINQIENGVRKHPSVPVLKKIASALEIPYEEFLLKAGYIQNNTLKSPSESYIADDRHDIPILTLPEKKATKKSISLPHVQNPNFFAVEVDNNYLIINPTLKSYKKEDTVLILKNKKPEITLHKGNYPKDTEILGKIIWTISPTSNG